MKNNSKAAILLTFLLVPHAAVSLASRPHYLAYFNSFSGPKAMRHTRLADSNLDWGQGLPELTEWLKGNQQARMVYLSYFGSDDPQFYRLKNVTRFGDLAFDLRPRVLPSSLGPGLYVFGSTQFERVYSVVRGPWTQEREQMFRTLHLWLSEQSARPLNSTIKTNEGRLLTTDEIQLAMVEYDALTLGRITHKLQKHQPAAILCNGAVLVYELKAEDLD